MEFLGEGAEDGGGPTREFWACIAKDINEYFEGQVDRKVPFHDVIGLQVANCVCMCLGVYMHVCRRLGFLCLECVYV